MKMTELRLMASKAKAERRRARNGLTKRFALACMLSLAGWNVQSQPAEWFRAAERSEPHEALVFFEGTWSASGRSGWREVCTWLPEGRRHIVCKPRWETAKGTAEGLTVFSFDELKGVYHSHVFQANGKFSVENGRPVPGGFQFESESGAGAERVRERLTLQDAADGRVSAVAESAKGDGPWVFERKTDYLRTRP
ncbi:MAG: hypothetical protein V4844_12930 [Pseudomonadota bacterium]